MTNLLIIIMCLVLCVAIVIVGFMTENLNIALLIVPIIVSCVLYVTVSLNYGRKMIHNDVIISQVNSSFNNENKA